VTGTATNLLSQIVPLDLSTITDEIDGVLSDVLDTVLDPVQSLLSQVGGTLLDPLFDALEDVLSIRVNVQSKAGGAFTERAIQIRVLPNGVGVNTAAAGDSLATVNLASATVGPGSGSVGGEGDDETPADDDTVLPHTGLGDASAPLAAIGLGMVLAGAAATAGAGMANRPAGAHAAARGRRTGGRHARR
jgi:hypothetical protein